jgi:hypothetical protein
LIEVTVLTVFLLPFYEARKVMEKQPLALALPSLVEPEVQEVLEGQLLVLALPSLVEPEVQEVLEGQLQVLALPSLEVLVQLWVPPF